MPNRIIKESICSSDTIDALSWFEEVVFYRLMVNCDDYGRFDGRPSIIKNRLFPLKENLTQKTVSSAIDSLANKGLVVLYEFEGKPYLYLPTWNKHQSVRAKKSKYPSPDEAMKSHEITCNQMQSNVTVIQSNSYSYSESESNANISTEPQSAPVLMMPLVDGSEYGISQAEIDEWSEAYPAVDVLQQLREMRAWCNANPKNKKTRKGVARFITGWLSKEQNRAPRVSASAPQQEAPRQRVQTTSWRDEPDFVPGWEGR